MKRIMLKPNDTTVDHQYQRELDSRRVEAISRSLDPDLIGVPVVSRREDGSIVRIDGQHRLAAMIAAGEGDKPILMEVHEGLSLHEESQLFLRLNGGRKAVGAIDKYRARIVAREPVALEIQTILKRVGCKITRSAQRNGVSAVQAVEHAYHHGNLEKTMTTLTLWLDGDPQAFDGKLIRAVSIFLSAFPDADPTHLATRLEHHSAPKLITKLKRESQISSSTAEAAQVVLFQIYNHKTPRTKRVTANGIQSPTAVS